MYKDYNIFNTFPDCEIAFNGVSLFKDSLNNQENFLKENNDEIQSFQTQNEFSNNSNYNFNKFESKIINEYFIDEFEEIEENKKGEEEQNETNNDVKDKNKNENVEGNLYEILERINKKDKIRNKKIHKKKHVKEYEKKKNLPRYIIRNCVMSIISGKYEQIIRELPSMNDKLYEDFICYFKKNVEFIKDISSIRKNCIQNSLDEKENLRNFHFVEFCKFYLKEKYPKYVLSIGKMEDKQKFLKYANFLIIKIQNPQEFYCNS